MTSLNFDSSQLSSMELYGLKLQKVVADFTDFDAITKKYVDEKVAQAKSELTNGASSALDTFKELEDYLTSSGVSVGLTQQIADLSSAIATEKGRAEGAESSISSRVTALESDSTTGAALSAVQSELDAVETGAGLDHNGSYVAESARYYIGGATSLKSADALLDTALKTLRYDLDRQDQDRDESVALEVATLNDTINANFTQMEEADESATTDRNLIKGDLFTEQVAREDADIALSGRVDVFESGITEDGVTDLSVQNAVDRLRGAIQYVDAARVSDRDAEQKAREDEDVAINSRINSNDAKHDGHDVKHSSHESTFAENLEKHNGHESAIQGLGARPYAGSGFDVQHGGVDDKYLYFSSKWRLYGASDGSRLIFEYDKGDGTTSDWKTAVPFISS